MRPLCSPPSSVDEVQTVVWVARGDMQEFLRGLEVEHRGVGITPLVRLISQVKFAQITIAGSHYFISEAAALMVGEPRQGRGDAGPPDHTQVLKEGGNLTTSPVA